MADRRHKPIPTGRVRRTAKVGGLISSTAAKAAAARASGVGRSPEERRAAFEQWQVEAAEQVVEVLGNMKGLAMKVGQIASFVDTTGLPPDAQERIQAKLAALRDSAPRVPFEGMKKVMEEDLGERLSDVFAEFDEEAVAAASIGQVYRARLHDGREVAVKVQYPGVAQAVRADLQNLGLILRLAKRIAPGLDAKAVAAELRARLSEELDYEHEAQSHRAFARKWRGHPFIVVPDVMTEFCRDRVLVTEWIDGTGFEQLRERPQPERDRLAEIIFRFFFGCLYRNRHISGDPHPGNYLLMDDGRVAFLDFGMTKRVPREQHAQAIKIIQARLREDVEGVAAGLVEMGIFEAEDKKLAPETLYEYFRAVTDWYLEDGERTLTTQYAGQVLIDMSDPRSEHWSVMRRGTVPPDAMLVVRMEGLTLGVLAQLNATANWHRIALELLFGDPPSTPLGEEEAEFFGGRHAAESAA